MPRLLDWRNRHSMDIPTDTLIPHRPPMQWLESLLDCSETEARATVHFTNEHFAVYEGDVLESALIECMAQTVAAAQGFRARQKADGKKPNMGMLAAVSNFKLVSRAPLNVLLEITVKQVKRLGPMLMVSGRVFHREQTIATADLLLYA